MEVRIASGMEVATISVERQLPRNSRTVMPVRKAAVTISRTTSSTESRTKPDASFRGVIVVPAGRVLRIAGIIRLMPETTARVEASPLLSTWISTACLPCTSTALICGGAPRCT